MTDPILNKTAGQLDLNEIKLSKEGVYRNLNLREPKVLEALGSEHLKRLAGKPLVQEEVPPEVCLPDTFELYPFAVPGGQFREMSGDYNAGVNRFGFGNPGDGFNTDLYEFVDGEPIQLRSMVIYGFSWSKMFLMGTRRIIAHESGIAELINESTGELIDLIIYANSKIHYSCVRISDTQLIMAGGYDYNLGDVTDEILLIDIDTLDVTPIANLLVAKEMMQAVLAGNKIYFFGGLSYSLGIQATIEVLDLSDNSLSVIGLIPEYLAIADMAVVAIDLGRIAYIGGIDSNSNYITRIAYYHYDTDFWELSTLECPKLAAAGIMYLADTKKCVIFGGMTDVGEAIQIVDWIYVLTPPTCKTAPSIYLATITIQVRTRDIEGLGQERDTILLGNEGLHVAVTAHYSDGSNIDVTDLSQITFTDISQAGAVIDLTEFGWIYYVSGPSAVIQVTASFTDELEALAETAIYLWTVTNVEILGLIEVGQYSTNYWDLQVTWEDSSVDFRTFESNWVAINPLILSSVSNGEFYAEGFGGAQITAEYFLLATLDVTVTPALSYIYVTPFDGTFYVQTGYSYQFRAYAVYGSGDPVEITNDLDVYWSVSPVLGYEPAVNPAISLGLLQAAPDEIGRVSLVQVSAELVVNDTLFSSSTYINIIEPIRFNTGIDYSTDICAPIIYLTAPLYGVQEGHTFIWQQVSGGIVTIENPTLANAYYLAVSHATRKFQFVVDLGLPWETRYDFDVNATPTSNVSPLANLFGELGHDPNMDLTTIELSQYFSTTDSNTWGGGASITEPAVTWALPANTVNLHSTMVEVYLTSSNEWIALADPVPIADVRVAYPLPVPINALGLIRSVNRFKRGDSIVPLASPLKAAASGGPYGIEGIYLSINLFGNVSTVSSITSKIVLDTNQSEINVSGNIQGSVTVTNFILSVGRPTIPDDSFNIQSNIIGQISVTRTVGGGVVIGG